MEHRTALEILAQNSQFLHAPAGKEDGGSKFTATSTRSNKVYPAFPNVPQQQQQNPPEQERQAQPQTQQQPQFSLYKDPQPSTEQHLPPQRQQSPPQQPRQRSSPPPPASNEADELAAVARELKALAAQNDALASEKEELEDIVQEMDAERQELEAERKQLYGQLDERMKEIQAKDRQYRKVLEQAEKRCHDTEAAANQRVEKMQSALTALQAKLAETEKDAGKEASGAAAESAALQAKITTHAEDLARERDNNQYLETELSTACAQLADMETTLGHCRDDLAKKCKAFDELQDTIKEQRTDAAESEAKAAAQQKKIAALEAKLSASEGQRKDAERANDEKVKQLEATMEKQYANLRNKLGRLKNIEDERDRLVDERTKLKDALAKRDARLEDVNETLEGFQNIFNTMCATAGSRAGSDGRVPSASAARAESVGSTRTSISGGALTLNYKSIVNGIVEKLSDVFSALAHTREDLQEREGEMAALRARLDAAVQDHGSTSDVCRRAQDELSTAKLDLVQARLDSADAQAELSARNTVVERLQREGDALRTQVAQGQEACEAAVFQHAELEAQVAQLTVELKEEKARARDAAKSRDALFKKLEAAQEELATVKADMAALQAKTDAVHEDMRQAQDLRVKTQRKVFKLTEDLKKAEDELKETRAECSSAVSRIAKMDVQSHKRGAAAESAQERVKMLQDEIQRLRSELDSQKLLNQSISRNAEDKLRAAKSLDESISQRLTEKEAQVQKLQALVDGEREYSQTVGGKLARLEAQLRNACDNADPSVDVFALLTAVLQSTTAAAKKQKRLAAEVAAAQRQRDEEAERAAFLDLELTATKEAASVERAASMMASPEPARPPAAATTTATATTATRPVSLPSPATSMPSGPRHTAFSSYRRTSSKSRYTKAK